MRVALNIAPLLTGHKTRGMGYYVQNLLKNLKNINELEIVEFSEKIIPKGCDLIHYPYFDFFINSLPFQKYLPTVVTIGDVTPLVFPKHYPPGIKGRINLTLQKYSLKNTSAVITFSQYSKKDITKILKINNQKIYPIHLGVSKEFKVITDQSLLKKVKDKYNLPSKFALFVSNVNWNKNILNITSSTIESNLDLVIIGKSFQTTENLDHPELKSFKEFKDKFSQNKLVHILGFVDEEDLAVIYNLAELLVFPTYYEGFGLPILEAQACGTPILTSDTSSMPEIAGQAAIFVDPTNVKQIKSGIEKIINDKYLQNKLINLGFENIKKFSWQKTANQTFEVYKKVLNERNP